MVDCVVMGSVSDNQSVKYDGLPATYRNSGPDILINGIPHNGHSSLHCNNNSGHKMMPTTVLPNKLTPIPEMLSPTECNQVNNALCPVQDPSITSQSSPGFWPQPGSPPPYCGPAHPEPDVIPLRPDGPQIQYPQQWSTYVKNPTFQEPPPLIVPPRISPPHTLPPHTSPPPATHIPQPSSSPSGIPIGQINLPQSSPQAISSLFNQSPQIPSYSQQQPKLPYPYHPFYNLSQLEPIPNNLRLNIQNHHITPFGSVTSFEVNGTIYYSYNGQLPMMPGYVPFIPQPGPVYFNIEDNEMVAKGTMKQNGDLHGKFYDDRRPLLDEAVLPPIDELKPEHNNCYN